MRKRGRDFSPDDERETRIEGYGEGGGDVPWQNGRFYRGRFYNSIGRRGRGGEEGASFRNYDAYVRDRISRIF